MDWLAIRETLWGHFWTVVPALTGSLKRFPRDGAEDWSTEFRDAWIGPVRLTGRIRHAPGAQDLLMVVHGMGGSTGSFYMRRAVEAANAAGLSYLLLNLRGADGHGDDYYHAGLTQDLHVALRSADLQRYRRLFVVGYSLGGHLALRLATEAADARLAAVAAVCAPVDLARTASALDRSRVAPHRWAVMLGMHRLGRAVAWRRRDWRMFLRIHGIGTIRRWDQQVVAPRHGFRDADDYYLNASVGPRLEHLKVPALLVAAEHDPMVTASSVRPSITKPLPNLDVRWITRGGHVSFPPDFDIGMPTPLGLEPQVLAWLQRHARVAG